MIKIDLPLSTPALLFPAISLLLLAYNNRFLTLATLIRSLKGKYLETHDHTIIEQIKNLRRRLFLIRNMQVIGISSILGCVLTMLLIFGDFQTAAHWTFGISMIALFVSLGLSIREILISTFALNVELKSIEEMLN
ncbi:MAG: DUF2721 domain-containing protein [Saprospiraceae bacterium]|nr:DUF2721 domain-containing protein [Saprospiraceae bacterium]MBP7699220.1 DUF2721 domain-containing protein [Saprospiraceae bacterium]